MADERKLDKVTEALARLPKMMEDAIAKGFDRVLGVVGNKADKIIVEGKKHHEESLRQDEETEAQRQKREQVEIEQKRREEAAGRARELRRSVEHNMRIQGLIQGGMTNLDKNFKVGYSKGIAGLQQRFFFFLNQSRLRGEQFYQDMEEKVRKGFERFGTSFKDTFKGIIQTYTGPFYGLFRNIGGVLGPVFGRIFNRPLGMIATAGDALKTKVADSISSKMGKLEGKVTGVFSKLFEKSGEKAGSAALSSFKNFAGLFGNAPAAATPIEHKRGEGQKSSRVEAMKFSRLGSLGDIFGGLGTGVAVGGASNFGEGAGVPGEGGGLGGGNVVSLLDDIRNNFEGHRDLYSRHYDFYREQLLSINDYLDKIKKRLEKGEGGGLSDLLPGGGGGGKAGWMAKAKHFAFGKWGTAAASGAGALAGGIETYKSWDESKKKYGSGGAGQANAIARGMISGSLATIGASLGGATGAAIGGFLGDKIGDASNWVGEKIGDGIFDMKEAIAPKFESMVTSVGNVFSNAKNSITQTFDKVGEGFKGAQNFIKTKIDAFLPSGQTIMDVLSNILNGLKNAGTAAVTMVRNTSAQVYNAGAKAGKATAEMANKAGTAVKGLFNIGGSRWKAETKGVNPELMGAFEAAAADYKKQTGKTPTLTEGVRTREQQAILGQGNKYMTAKPGMSVHEKGFGLDLNSADAREMERLGILQKHGLTRPYGEKDPVHVELARLASAQERSKIRAGKYDQVASTTPVVSAPRAAAGAYVNRGGLAEIHKAEIVSPIGKFTDMLSKTAIGVAAPAVAARSSMDGVATTHLAAIASGINKLIAVASKEGTSSPYAERGTGGRGTPVPDFPADPGVIFGGNYFPQKGRQW